MSKHDTAKCIFALEAVCALALFVVYPRHYIFEKREGNDFQSNKWHDNICSLARIRARWIDAHVMRVSMQAVR
jgi:hypothetical protein